MKDYMKIVIAAVKSWVRHDAFTADDALEVVDSMGVIEPLRATDGTVYTSPEGEIYTL